MAAASLASATLPYSCSAATPSARPRAGLRSFSPLPCKRPARLLRCQAEAKDATEKAKEAISQGWNEIGGQVQAAQEKAQEGADYLGGQAKDAVQKAKETASGAWDNLGDAAEAAKEKAKEGADYVGDKSQEGAGAAKENAEAAKGEAKKGASWVAEGVESIGEQAKKTVDGA